MHTCISLECNRWKRCKKANKVCQEADRMSMNLLLDTPCRQCSNLVLNVYGPVLYACLCIDAFPSYVYPMSTHCYNFGSAPALSLRLGLRHCGGCLQAGSRGCERPRAGGPARGPAGGVGQPARAPQTSAGSSRSSSRSCPILPPGSNLLRPWHPSHRPLAGSPCGLAGLRAAWTEEPQPEPHQPVGHAGGAEAHQGCTAAAAAAGWWLCGV